MYSEHSAAIAAPPQRRRRQALACLQCRRRKIKCDQNKPCSQCQRSKDAICTYGSDSNPVRPYGSLLGNDIPHSYSQLAAHSQAGARHELESMFQIPTPQCSTAAASAAHSPHSTAASRVTGSDLSESHAIISKYPIQGLRTLVDDLQEQTAPSWYTPDIERHVPDRECMPDVSLSLRQRPLKTKLFGENHWMNHFTQVGSSLHRLFMWKNTKKIQV